MDDDTDVTGLGLAFGTSEEGRAWVGRRTEPRVADAPVSVAMIRYYCSLLEDANPAYWERGEAPPGMLMTWGFPLQWRPTGGDEPKSVSAVSVPLPGRHIINVSTDTEFLHPIRAGDSIRVIDEIVDVSTEKRTRLGRGHFITTRTEFSRDDAELVAVNVNVLFRYDVEEGEE